MKNYTHYSEKRLQRLQPWFLDMISEWFSEEFAVKPRRLPRLKELGEFVWTMQLAKYFACITPRQRAVTLSRLSAEERAIIVAPAPQAQPSATQQAEALYTNQMRAKRYYAKLTPAQKAEKIEGNRRRNPPKGRALLDPVEKKRREQERARKEAARRYRRIKADPEKYAAYLSRKRREKSGSA